MSTSFADCVHRGTELEQQRILGCNSERYAKVYTCDIHGKASPRRKVRVPDTARPDRGVAICLGCDQYEEK